MKNYLSLFVVLVTLLSACGVTPERLSGDYQLASMQYLQGQKKWSFEGRLALVNENESISAAVVWSHDENIDDIELTGPLAQGRLKIHVGPEQVVVDDGENRSVFEGDAEAVLADQLGMVVPVSALRYWVLGVNDPQQALVEVAGGFFQAGWLVRYREMQMVGADLLPKKVTAEKDKTRIKLVVDQWQLL